MNPDTLIGGCQPACHGVCCDGPVRFQATRACMCGLAFKAALAVLGQFICALSCLFDILTDLFSFSPRHQAVIPLLRPFAPYLPFSQPRGPRQALPPCAIHSYCCCSLFYLVAPSKQKPGLPTPSPDSQQISQQSISEANSYCLTLNHHPIPFRLGSATSVRPFEHASVLTSHTSQPSSIRPSLTLDLLSSTPVLRIPCIFARWMSVFSSHLFRCAMQRC